MLPCPSMGSHLQFWYAADGWPHRFTWLVEGGVYHGALSMDHARSQDNDSAYIDKLHLWRFERGGDATAGFKAIAMVGLFENNVV